MSSFLVLLGSMVASLYFAIMYENTEFMLLVYLQAALFVLSFFVVLYRKLTIRGELDIPVGIAEHGKENLVKLKVRNKGFLPMTRMEALIEIEDISSGHISREWLKVSPVLRGENNFAAAVAFSGTGTYRVCLRKLKVFDFTGLFSGKVQAKGEKKIQVMPRIYNIPVQLSLMVRNFFGEAEVYDDFEPGYDNSELLDVREYQEGDGLRKIHWKLSAKRDELLVKEYALPRACPVVVLLDFHPTEERKRPEQMVPYLETVASLTYSLFDVNCPHYVAWFDEKEQDVVRLRVDDEESLFFFLGTLLEIVWKEPKEDLNLRYQDKYKGEPYVWALSLDEKLVLKKGEENVARLSEGELEQSLQQVVLVL